MVALRSGAAASVLLASAMLSGCGPASEAPAPVERFSSARARVKTPTKAHCSVTVRGAGTLGMETEYLPRVIQCENGGAGLEALKAQAIAARSVAYYEMATRGSICDSQACQVYSCGKSPSAEAYRAVAETAGQYLSYDSLVTYGFYVDGDHGTSSPSCRGSRWSGRPGASREKYITYNEGRTGAGVTMTSLGYRPPGGGIFGQNRGCMSQWGARCLEGEGRKYDEILRFYYGEDIEIRQADGPCVDEVAIPPDDDPEPEDPELGTVLGVIWDLSTGSSPSGSDRIDTATVAIDGGDPQPVRAGDAFWELALPPGAYTVTAAAPGFVSATREVEVSTGAKSWASLGLWPDLAPVSVSVLVTNSQGAPLDGAIVHVPGVGARQAAGGTATFELEIGDAEVRAYHAGYASRSQAIQVSPGGAQSVELALAAESPPASTGRLQGVVWDASKASSPAASGDARLGSAIAICSCGLASAARASDGYFRIDAPPGDHTFTILAPGFESAVFGHSLASGASDWRSVGLTPAP